MKTIVLVFCLAYYKLAAATTPDIGGLNEDPQSWDIGIGGSNDYESDSNRVSDGRGSVASIVVDQDGSEQGHWETPLNGQLGDGVNKHPTVSKQTNSPNVNELNTHDTSVNTQDGSWTNSKPTENQNPGKDESQNPPNEIEKVTDKDRPEHEKDTAEKSKEQLKQDNNQLQQKIHEQENYINTLIKTLQGIKEQRENDYKKKQADIEEARMQCHKEQKKNLETVMMNHREAISKMQGNHQKQKADLEKQIQSCAQVVKSVEKAAKDANHQAAKFSEKANECEKNQADVKKQIQSCAQVVKSLEKAAKDQAAKLSEKANKCKENQNESTGKLPNQAAQSSDFAGLGTWAYPYPDAASLGGLNNGYDHNLDFDTADVPFAGSNVHSAPPSPVDYPPNMAHFWPASLGGSTDPLAIRPLAPLTGLVSDLLSYSNRKPQGPVQPELTLQPSRPASSYGNRIPSTLLSHLLGGSQT